MLSLDRLRRAARALAKDHKSGDPVARQRVKMQVVRSEETDLKHADFLHVIARETGFESWPKLKLAAETQGLDRAAKLQRLNIALFEGRGWVVETLLAETPDLASESFGLACALYDLDQVRSALAAEPTLATQQFGPRRPILHLAFSKWIKARPELEGNMMAIAELLVKHGADVNDGFPAAPGSDHLLSAVYGAIGHADNMVLGRWLLEQGADPNDEESLYHATELGHHDGLRMLLEHGADPKGTNALLRAMDFDDVDAVRLLLEHGARADDFDDAHVGGEAPWVVPALHQAARRGSSAEMVELLLDHGANPARVFEGASAYGYARVFGNRCVSAAIETRGAETELTAVERAMAEVADGRVPEVRLNSADLPDAYRHIIRMILYLPGRMDHVKRLIEAGLDFDAPDNEGLTPLQVAGWEGLPDVMDYFLSLGADKMHVNGYGGGLMGTILHGAENCPARAQRDHVECARRALEAGVPLLQSELRFVGREDLSGFFEAWIEEHPDSLVRS